MNIMMLGDVYSTPGRTVLSEHLAELINEYEVDFTIVNGENASGGNGLTKKNADSLLSLPIDVLTMGNHVWNQREIADYIDDVPQIVRPANYPEPCPGKGFRIFEKNGARIGVMNISGLVYMPAMGQCPFAVAEKIVNEYQNQFDILAVDFHGEATSEKLAMGYMLDGKASIVVGTHTHVQTSDYRILPGGTAYITDLGMTGPTDSVIGIVPESSISMFLGNPPKRYEQAKGKCKLEGAVFTINAETGKCRSVEAIRIM